MSEPSTLLQGMFVVLGLTLGIGFVVAIHAAWRRTGATAHQTRRATLLALAGTTTWMAGTLALASAGVLRFDSVPPTMMIMIAAIFGLAAFLGFSPVGARLAAGLSLPVLVAVQGFRLPLELMMHRAYTEGVMPVQMSYSGFNFDIVTGGTAILVAAALATGLAGRRVAAAWNVLGIGLLLGILVIAFLSAPLPIRVFMNEPANVWITHAPFIWLPAVMVFSAILGHIIVLRRLRLEAVSGATVAAAAPARQRAPQWQ